jgi:hypothetical protein
MSPEPAAFRARRFALEGAAERGTRGLQRRHETEHQTGDDGQQRGEREGRAVQTDRAEIHRADPGLGVEMQRRGGIQCREDPNAPPRDRDAGGAAGEREQQALGEQLTDQPRAARANGEPHGDLPPAPRRANEEQVRDVRAGREQDEAHGGEQHEERPPYDRVRARCVEFTCDRAPVERSDHRIRVLLIEDRTVPLHRFLGLRRRDAGLEPRGDVEAVTPRLAEHVRRQRHHGQQHVRAAGQPAESGRQHADHSVRLAIDRDRPAEHRRIGVELPLPQRIGEDRDVRGAGRDILVGQEIPAERGLDAEQRQIARAHDLVGETLRPLAAGERALVLHGERDVAEHRLRLAHRREFRV